jgi:hypothetical protein
MLKLVMTQIMPLSYSVSKEYRYSRHIKRLSKAFLCHEGQGVENYSAARLHMYPVLATHEYQWTKLQSLQ